MKMTTFKHLFTFPHTGQPVFVCINVEKWPVIETFNEYFNIFVNRIYNIPSYPTSSTSFGNNIQYELIYPFPLNRHSHRFSLLERGSFRDSNKLQLHKLGFQQEIHVEILLIFQASPSGSKPSRGRWILFPKLHLEVMHS